eukprot:CAMPEP_0180316628 /NCGR_PEP_ID=MMETSP0988-20121125/33369_1 /TAXON_ID=697907 /ORGANISM="non described non described, Strain CCMP2293" /LENGTH=84 /DNA_ID=CAMNT_0022301757 /DNA_START=169 /DNA_END=420 /DNA_ORIENTATION=+
MVGNGGSASGGVHFDTGAADGEAAQREDAFPVPQHGQEAPNESTHTKTPVPGHRCQAPTFPTSPLDAERDGRDEWGGDADPEPA